jgi:TPR repeat protein
MAAEKVVKRSNLYEEALSLAESRPHDCQPVLDKLNAASAAGDDRATYALATWYLHGKHVGKDIARATVLLRLAADAGNSDAIYDLAYSHESGAGVDKDERTAFLLYVKAALIGHSQATYEVGRCYCYGVGTAVDLDLSDVWTRRARQLGVED